MNQQELLEMFLDESGEHLETLNERVLVLEKTPDDAETINEIFRAAHSLKGTSGSMGFTRLQRLTHDMENIFSLVREGNLSVDSDLVDLLFKCLDAIQEYLNNISNSSDEGTNDNKDLIDSLGKYLSQDGVTASEKDNKKAAKKEAKTDPSGETAEKKGSDTSEGDKDVNRKKVLRFEPFEIDAVKEAEAEGQNCILISVVIDSNCLLKSVRAFMVFKKLEGKAEIIKLSPSAQDIEDEKFDFDFSMVILTALSKEDVEKRLSKIAELESLAVTVLKSDDIIKMQEETASKEEEKPEKENDTTASPQTAPANSVSEEASVPQQKAKKKTVTNHSVRVDIEKLDNLMNLVSELIIAKNSILANAKYALEPVKGDGATKNYKQDMDYLDRITSNLHESVMRVRMVPIESVLSRFGRMVRDLSKKLNKEIELHISGEDTELDRTVIDEIGDPIMHMIRNSADHGLEDTETRIKLGKPATGNIWIDASQVGDNVIIKVSDDGGGINTEKVLEKALKNGNVTPDEAKVMSQDDIIGLLFKPSFSTAEKVSDVSGRGVGLDVVKNKIEGLGGDVTVETELGKGSTFIIRLPLTLAIIKALMVSIDNETYAIPTSTISIVEIIKFNDVNYIQDKPFINLRGEVIPLIFMREYFGMENMAYNDGDEIIVAIVRKNKKACGIVIDSYIGQQEIVIKPIGDYIDSPKIISGSTILGDGSVALILEPNALF
ncbi:MAG: chemotaxis protein CheA [Eubacterium sp.]|nr:chemotaxis protein CheA [Eubacterium sp.]